ncbi:MAG: aldehyde dehydrogenase family protein [Steroidobacteraceae bacterium]
MKRALQFYINGAWVDPVELRTLDVLNPATEQVIGQIALGSAADVDAAVRAARAAFPAWSRTSREERVAVLERAVAQFKLRHAEIGETITREMGAPAAFAHKIQAGVGMVHLKTAARVLKDFQFMHQRGTTWIAHEPIGVCALITPWNWPINQIAAKVAPALATGCTMVLKPSEIAPYSALIWAEILEAAGVPPGVFNLVNGDGPTVGAALSSHPDVDMVSFTGSTQAGIDVAQRAARTVKRVAQELGGKSPHIILDDEVFAHSVATGVRAVMTNSGQSCNAPTRMLVPHKRMQEAAEIARSTVLMLTVGDPTGDVHLGPVASQSQWSKIQNYIRAGTQAGASLVVGGLGRPAGLDRGYFVKPTVFANATNSMEIAREEIFGPVLVLIGYETIDDAARIANDTDYGLAAYVSGADSTLLDSLASRLRAAQVILNGAAADPMAPFGGYKMSGNGREWGDFGFHEYLEIKAILGRAPPATAHS